MKSEITSYLLLYKRNTAWPNVIMWMKTSSHMKKVNILPAF